MQAVTYFSMLEVCSPCTKRLKWWIAIFHCSIHHFMTRDAKSQAILSTKKNIFVGFPFLKSRGEKLSIIQTYSTLEYLRILSVAILFIYLQLYLCQSSCSKEQVFPVILLLLIIFDRRSPYRLALWDLLLYIYLYAAFFLLRDQ